MRECVCVYFVQHRINMMNWTTKSAFNLTTFVVQFNVLNSSNHFMVSNIIFIYQNRSYFRHHHNFILNWLKAKISIFSHSNWDTREKRRFDFVSHMCENHQLVHWKSNKDIEDLISSWRVANSTNARKNINNRNKIEEVVSFIKSNKFYPH